MKTPFFFIVVLLCAICSPASAEELVMEYQGLDLLGNLEIADGNKGLSGKNIVLIVHDTLSSKQENLISSLQMGLKARSVNSLAINLSLGLDMRKGRYDCKIEQNHRHKDALGEMARWIKWLKKQKVRRIHLVGQGRGANQVTLYARNARKSRLGKVVLISPLAWTFEKAEQDYQSRYGKPLNDILQQAKAMIADHEGNMLMDAGFLGCAKTRVTAYSFENYYSPNAEYFTPALLDSLRKRDVLTVVGEYDSGSREVVATLQSRMGRTRQKLKVIAGADKGFGGVYQDHLVEAVGSFLK